MDMKPLLILLAVIMSMVIGYMIGRERNRSHIDGIFRVDTTNPEKDVFTVELDCPIGAIPHKDVMIFKVENVSSQEKPFA